jgi:alpha-beta hydrolase superfamily lysophospholipase
MEATNFIFTCDDSTPLYGYKWAPEAAPRAMIHIVHGLAEYGVRYDRTARVLAEGGYLVYAHDHRGHGRTAAAPERCGTFAERDGWNRAVKDVCLLIESERRENSALPMIVLGHSMGSFMAQQMMYERPELLDACILSGCYGKPDFRATILRIAARLERMRIGARGRSALLHKLSLDYANKAFRPTRTRFDWLTRDKEEVDRFDQDPLCGWIGTSQLWIDLTHGALEVARPANLKRVPANLPVYIVAGTMDPVSNGGKSLKFLIDAYRSAGLTDVRYKFYPDGRHEMLNEINRDEVVDDLLLWLDAVSRKKRT